MTCIKPHLPLADRNVAASSHAPFHKASWQLAKQVGFFFQFTGILVPVIFLLIIRRSLPSYSPGGFR